MAIKGLWSSTPFLLFKIINQFKSRIMCYHGNELESYPRTLSKPKESLQQENSVFKGKGGPTYAGHLPKKYW